MKPLASILLILGLLAPVAARGDEVPWLARVTVPQLAGPPSPAEWPPLPRDEAGRPIDDLTAWQARRAKLRRRWLKFLGPLPKRPASAEFEVVSTERLDKCVRQRVRYEAEVGRTVEAFLLKPKGDSPKPRPAVVVFHPTTKETANVVAGTGGRPEQHLGLRLAERGFVALCPANFLWEEPNYLKSVAAAKERNPDSLGMATMLGDGIRAVDLLAAMPEVDPERIGAIGHSLGAKEVLYLMAFDDRVRAGVFSEGGIGMTFSNWDAPWYLGPAINEPDFPRNHHELIALIAPRPFLVFAGESGRGAADGDRSWPYLWASRDIYALHGEPFRAGLWNHRQGHRFSPAMAEKGFEWLETYLGAEKE
jgi:dienelactone hydrolase